jgi:purine-binding chemotaxis protein CheW
MPPAPDVERQLVVFSLHGEYYGLPIAAVREIIRYVPPSATAAATGLIQGMISLRERTLPIVDLSSRLGQRLEIGSGTRILVLEVAHGALGLIVDTVDGILPVPAERIEPLPVAADDRLGAEVAAVGDRLIVVIDPERALGDLIPAPPTPPAPAPRRRTTTAKPTTAKPSTPKTTTRKTITRKTTTPKTSAPKTSAPKTTPARRRRSS